MSEPQPELTGEVMPNSERTRLTAAIKPRDAWWARWVIGPLANRVVGRLAPYPWITPNRLTVLSLAVGIAAGALFAARSQPALAAGGLVLQLSFLLDCADGQLARFRGSSSVFGAILDRICDRVKFFAVLLGLAIGSFRAAGGVEPLVLAFAYFFSDYMVESYVRTYRRFEGDATPHPGPDSPVARGLLSALRFLDLPIVRLGFADRYFLISAFTVAGQPLSLLRLLCLLGALQLVLRPVYSVLALRLRFGDWPWNDARRHHLGQNF